MQPTRTAGATRLGASDSTTSSTYRIPGTDAPITPSSRAKTWKAMACSEHMAAPKAFHFIHWLRELITGHLPDCGPELTWQQLVRAPLCKQTTSVRLRFFQR